MLKNGRESECASIDRIVRLIIVGVGWGWGMDHWVWMNLRCLAGCRGLAMAHSGKSLISFFQEFSSSINKIFILARGLGTRLSFNSYVPC